MARMIARRSCRNWSTASSDMSVTAPAGVLLALLCSGVQASENGLHRPTGITFPATAGTLSRQWIREKQGNPASVRVGYGKASWIEVTPSGGAPGAKLASMKRSILLRHAARVVDQPAAISAFFPGWQTAILEHRMSETGVPPGRMDRPRRDFVAARKCGKYLLSLRAWNVDRSNTEQLRRLGQAVREIFADPGSGSGQGYACK